MNDDDKFEFVLELLAKTGKCPSAYGLGFSNTCDKRCVECFKARVYECGAVNNSSEALFVLFNKLGASAFCPDDIEIKRAYRKCSHALRPSEVGCPICFHRSFDEMVKDGEKGVEVPHGAILEKRNAKDFMSHFMSKIKNITFEDLSEQDEAFIVDMVNKIQK